MRNQGQGHIRQRGKNGRRRGTIQSRSPGSYRIRYSLGSDPVTGKRRWATATVKGSRKDAERELTRRLRTVDTGEHPEPSKMSVADWLALWLASTKIEVSPKTHERYAEIVRRVAWQNPSRPVIANVDAREVRDKERLAKTLIQQVSGAVLWEQSVRYLWEQGVDTFVECGPGRVLCGLIKKIAPGSTLLNVENNASLEKSLAYLKESR